jgi:hypothetical protein
LASHISVAVQSSAVKLFSLIVFCASMDHGRRSGKQREGLVLSWRGVKWSPRVAV